MTTVTPDKPSQPRAPRADRAQAKDLQATSYDSVSSTLVALLITLGTAVGMLVIVWLSSRVRQPLLAVPVTMAPMGWGDDDEIGGGDGSDLEEPEPEQLAKEVDIPSPQVDQVVAVLEDGAAVVSDAINEPSLDDDLENIGGKRGHGPKGPGKGRGRAQKWEITFLEGATLDLYAKQLDFFKVELAAIDTVNDEIIYASGLAGNPVNTRQGKRDQEQRVFMSWRPGSSLREADNRLMAKAGVKNPRLLIVQFYPNEVIGRLQQLEKDFRGRDPKSIIKTRFGVRPQGAGYEFYVLEQVAR